MRMNGLMLCVMLNFGICTMECDDFNFVGPECNFKNIAYKKPSRQNSNTNPPYHSELANDDNVSTCSYTSENNKHTPWWNLWLSEYTTIKKLEFVTKDSHRGNFPYFTVKVYNTSKENFTRKSHLEGGTTCYQHSNSVQSDTKIQVTCDGSPVGNLIRLQLYSKYYQLVLCDFRLYEVCDDGSYGIGCESSCSAGCNGPCDKETGTCSQCKAGWKGNYCSEKCKEGTWGLNCNETCGKCDHFPCDRFTGMCPIGCSIGFKGQQCTEECDNGYYGRNCYFRCETGCSRYGRNTVCSKGNGTCLNGCYPGYTGLLCNKDCEDGKWGKDCQNVCGHCLFSPCNKVDGHCTGGCVAGYKYTWTCNTECDDRRYGIGCKGRCGKNCKDVCDKKTGMCSNCHSGWKGNNCSEECEDGKWGYNCQNDCGKCLTSPCNKVNGICSEGCAAGYQQTEECHTVCDPGYFGKDCKQQCNRTCSSSGMATCNHVNGTCLNGCFAGYTGTYCEFAGSVSRNEEMPNLKLTSIILGIIGVVLLVYAIVITVLCKRKTTQNASPGEQGNGSTPEVDVALSSDKGDEADHYNTINPQRTESAVYESIHDLAELSV